MSSTVFKVIELGEGEFILQGSNEDSEPLVSIKFSAEALNFLADNTVEVAKSMIEAGIHEVEDIMDEQVATYGQDSKKPRVLH